MYRCRQQRFCALKPYYICGIGPTFIVRPWCHYAAGGAYDMPVCTHNSSCAGAARRCRELHGGTQGEAVECGVKSDQYRRKPVTRSRIRGTPESRKRTNGIERIARRHRDCRTAHIKQSSYARDSKIWKSSRAYLSSCFWSRIVSTIP